MKNLKDMMGGRKWSSAALVAVFAAINDAAGLGIDSETIWFMGAIFGVFILGESVKDALSAFGREKEKVRNGSSQPQPPAAPSPGSGG